jgi:hypothetical protein
MSKRGKETFMQSSRTARRGRGDWLRAAPTIGPPIATFITIAAPAVGGSERFLLADSSTDRLN